MSDYPPVGLTIKSDWVDKPKCAGISNGIGQETTWSPRGLCTLLGRLLARYELITYKKHLNIEQLALITSTL